MLLEKNKTKEVKNNTRIFGCATFLPREKKEKKTHSKIYNFTTILYLEMIISEFPFSITARTAPEVRMLTSGGYQYESNSFQYW